VSSAQFVFSELSQDAPCSFLSESFFAYKLPECTAINSRIARKFPDPNLFLELANGFRAFSLNLFAFPSAVLSRFIKLTQVLTIRRHTVHFFSDEPDFFDVNGVPAKQSRGVFFARSHVGGERLCLWVGVIVAQDTDHILGGEACSKFGDLSRFGINVGYGYFSMRALWWLLALVIVGSLIYWRGYKAGSIVPTGNDAYDSFVTNKTLPGNYEAFHALPYSLENSFPLVKFSIQDKWAPGPDEQGANPQPVGWTSRFFPCIASPRFLRGFRWFQICAGWILATLFVAGVTGVIRKD